MAGSAIGAQAVGAAPSSAGQGMPSARLWPAAGIFDREAALAGVFSASVPAGAAFDRGCGVAIIMETGS